VLVTFCIPHGEDNEEKQTAFQYCHDEPEMNKQKKLNVCLHTEIPNACKHKNTSGTTFIQNSLWFLNPYLQSLRKIW